MTIAIKNNGIFLDSQGWSASHNGNDTTAYIPLCRDGMVIALAVAREVEGEDLDSTIENNATFIANACNKNKDIIMALQTIAAGHGCPASIAEEALVKYANN